MALMRRCSRKYCREDAAYWLELTTIQAVKDDRESAEYCGDHLTLQLLSLVGWVDIYRSVRFGAIEY